jgi:tetratricopeptide (TPR) repeat protein
MPTIAEAMSIALDHFRAGRLQPAEQLYLQVLAADSRQPEALYRLGLIALQVGRPDIAVERITSAIRLNNSNPEYHNNLGVAFANLGRMDQAIAAFQHGASLGPDRLDIHLNLAAALQRQGNLSQAIACYQQILLRKPDMADVHHELANALVELGNLDEAISSYTSALRTKSNDPRLLMQLGMALKAQGKLDEAIASYRRALQLRPDYAEALTNLGQALTAQGQLDEAIACCQRAVELNPNVAEAHHNLGCALVEQGKPHDAISIYRRALQLKPDSATTHFALGLALLFTGDFAHGWAEYEWRWRANNKSPGNFSQPQWDGRDLAGQTILLYAEQGCGDAIQFVRYVPEVVGRGGRVIVQCQPELHRLFHTVEGIDQIVAADQSPPPFEQHCPLMSLPLVLGTTLQTIPARVPYLRADPALCEHWRSKLAGDKHRLKVGLCWAGNPAMPGDRKRSMPLAALAALAGVPDVSFYSLQKGDAAKQALNPLLGLTLIDWTDELTDFADTAAFISQLDLVISACTSVAHLAGAMGKAAWTLLASPADWRWLIDREDTPWYPTMRLFRQSTSGDWPTVAQRIAAALPQAHPATAAS